MEINGKSNAMEKLFLCTSCSVKKSFLSGIDNRMGGGGGDPMGLHSVLCLQGAVTLILSSWMHTVVIA